jgi:hypothetical protein
MYINYQRAIRNSLNRRGLAPVFPEEVKVRKITQHFDETVILFAIFFVRSDRNLKNVLKVRVWRRGPRSLGVPSPNSVGQGVIPPFLAGCSRRTYAAIFSFMAGVMPPMPMFGRSLL